MTLGSRIQSLRKEHNMSQGDLADALDISRQSVSKWETDTATPDLDKLLKLSEIFDISLDELFNPEMNKTAKRLISILLVMVMCFSMLAPTAGAWTSLSHVNSADLAIEGIQPSKIAAVALGIGIGAGLAVQIEEIVVYKTVAGNLLDKCVDLVDGGGDVFGYGGVKNILNGGFGDPGLVVIVILAVVQLDQGSVCDLAAALVAKGGGVVLLGIQDPVILFANPVEKSGRQEVRGFHVVDASNTRISV